MNHVKTILIIGIFFCSADSIDRPLHAQGFGKPLTVQGIDAATGYSAASRASGGLLFSLNGDIGVMFSNPASLRSLRTPQLSLSGLTQSTEAEQKQQHAPLEYYSNFSLFMEGLTRYIPDPVYDTSVTTYTAADTVQRPFDDLSPNWTKSVSRTLPVHAFAATPLTLGGLSFSIGIGTVEYANLDWYFRNNNVLSPSILTPNPFVASRPANDADSSSVPVQWYQSLQQREGTIRGYGAAVAVTVFENLDVGVSGLILRGSSDDVEVRRERGRIRLYQNYFRAESVYYNVLRSGTSDYEGEEFSVSGWYRSRFVTFGATMKLPTTITRTFDGTMQTDTTGSSLSITVREKDKMTIPVRGTLALSIMIRENLRLGFEYELRPYSSAEFAPSSGTVEHPWKSANVFHIGAEYIPAEWIVFRSGVRQQAETFEPEGNPLAGEPVGYTVYAAGAGFSFANVRLNIGYEYYSMKFVDMWANAVSINTKRSHALSADISYLLPWNF